MNHVMIHGVPVKTYNALQNHIIVLLSLNGITDNKTTKWYVQDIKYGFYELHKIELLGIHGKTRCNLQ